MTSWDMEGSVCIGHLFPLQKTQTQLHFCKQDYLSFRNEIIDPVGEKMFILNFGLKFHIPLFCHFTLLRN